MITDKKLEVETIEVSNVKLDVWFTYNKDYGFEVESIEDVVGTQDLTNIISEYYLIQIEKKLTEMYRSNGWL